MSWAARLVPACQELAAALTAAGVPASLNRGAHVPGAWVMPATAQTVTLSGAGRARAHVLLVAKTGGDLEALRTLSGLLDLALAVITPAEPVDTSVVLPIGQNMHPAFRVSVDLKLKETST